ncbi:hypothetical protein [Paraburkholderia phytofirmans]|uniref:hypothetical protein n=1 Tax=Paraburkholderia phytofirmans TaxID=261302 RepID=UPI0038B83EDD
MKNLVIHLATLLMPVLVAADALAWSHANAYGGGTYHAPGSGSTTRTDFAGGSETHTYGQGTTATGRYGDTATHQAGSGQTTATNPYGGSATHTYGQGTSASNAYGGSAYHATGSGYTSYTSASGATAYHSAYYGARYPAYHPPVTVNTYGSGCYNCGGWSTAGAAAAGVAVGVAAGAAIASANTAAATSNAYNAGVAAGAAANPGFAMGAVYAVLPAGCVAPNVHGTTYYLCGNTWFAPAYGANGVYYRVVPAP